MNTNRWALVGSSAEQVNSASLSMEFIKLNQALRWVSQPSRQTMTSEGILAHYIINLHDVVSYHVLIELESERGSKWNGKT